MSAPNLPRRGNVPQPHSSFATANSPFPPPPRRTGQAGTGPTSARPNPFYNAGNPARSRQPQPAAPPPTPPRPANTSAEAYASFARYGAKQRDKEEQKGKQDAFRGFQKMAPGASPTGESFVPPPPRTTTRHPTAPRTSTYIPKSAGTANHEAPGQRGWDDFEKGGRKTTTGAETSTGFPGVSRAQSTRKQGFMPSTPAGDEPAAPRTSAYASYTRGERLHSSQAPSYFTEAHNQTSAQNTPARPPVSPLRHARSSNGLEEERRSDRPNLERVSTRYHGVGGERTDLKGPGLGRSSSVRNSPVTAPWDAGVNGLHQTQSQDPQSRARNPSPMPRRPLSSQRENNASETSSCSSSDDEEIANPWVGRNQAPPHPATHKPASADSRGNTAFAGQFPGTSYVQGPAARNVDGTRTTYRPQPPPRSRPVSQAAFNYVPTYAQPTPPAGVNGAAGPTGPGGSKMYAPFSLYPRTPLYKERVPLSSSGVKVPSLRGFPSWAVPSSILPPHLMPRTPIPSGFRTGNTGSARARQINVPVGVAGMNMYTGEAADPNSRFSNDGHLEPPRPTSHQDDGREPIAKEGFPAADWNDKFSGPVDYFRPPTSPATGRKSPTRSSKPRAKSYNHPSSTKGSGADAPVNIPEDIARSADPGAAFVPGNFSAEEWAEKLKYQAAARTREVEQGKGTRKGSRAPPSERLRSPQPKGSHSSGQGSGLDTARGPGILDNDIDPMDLDESMNTDESAAQQSNGVSGGAPRQVRHDEPNTAQEQGHDMNLRDLADTAPLKPSGTGLGDLDDLGVTLPTDARASAVRPFEESEPKTAIGTVKALKLPNPPRDVMPPSDLTQATWAKYNQEMAAYMHDWNIFNKQMLDHFQGRQAQMEMTLSPKWLTALGDGPSGAEISKSIQDGDGRSPQRAGFAAYQQWMEEDKLVRTWWESACDHHEQVIINLGRFREMIKPLTGR